MGLRAIAEMTRTRVFKHFASAGTDCSEVIGVALAIRSAIAFELVGFAGHALHGVVAAVD
jgi:hypothetical protein